ncbi:hypothetical protein [Streptomyces sp. NPDC059080]|uniref:hypothetical protein n=1 Tax=Streptomyces sp. NPDC059080 TaxID=3346718 RepID=UPI0036D057DD
MAQRRKLISCGVLAGLGLLAAGLFSWWMISALRSPVEGWQDGPPPARPSAPVTFSVSPDPPQR